MATIDTRYTPTPQRPAAGRHPAQVLAFIVGVAYVIVGLVGFAATGFGGSWVHDGGADLLGFDVNGFHNIVHLGVGLILLIASTAPAPALTQGVLIGGGLVYVLAAFLGFTGQLDHLLSIDGKFGAADNWLHLVSGLAAIVAGFLGPAEAAPTPGWTAQAGAMGGPSPATAGPMRPDAPGAAAQADPSRQRNW